MDYRLRTDWVLTISVPSRQARVTLQYQPEATVASVVETVVGELGLVVPKEGLALYVESTGIWLEPDEKVVAYALTPEDELALRAFPLLLPTTLVTVSAPWLEPVPLPVYTDTTGRGLLQLVPGKPLTTPVHHLVLSMTTRAGVEVDLARTVAEYGLAEDELVEVKVKAGCRKQQPKRGTFLKSHKPDDVSQSSNSPRVGTPRDATTPREMEPTTPATASAPLPTVPASSSGLPRFVNIKMAVKMGGEEEFLSELLPFNSTPREILQLAALRLPHMSFTAAHVVPDAPGVMVGNLADCDRIRITDKPPPSPHEAPDQPRAAAAAAPVATAAPECVDLLAALMPVHGAPAARVRSRNVADVRMRRSSSCEMVEKPMVQHELQSFMDISAADSGGRKSLSLQRSYEVQWALALEFLLTDSPNPNPLLKTVKMRLGVAGLSPDLLAAPELKNIAASSALIARAIYECVDVLFQLDPLAPGSMPLDSPKAAVSAASPRGALSPLLAISCPPSESDLRTFTKALLLDLDVHQWGLLKLVATGCCPLLSRFETFLEATRRKLEALIRARGTGDERPGMIIGTKGHPAASVPANAKAPARPKLLQIGRKSGSGSPNSDDDVTGLDSPIGRDIASAKARSPHDPVAQLVEWIIFIITKASDFFSDDDECDAIPRIPSSTVSSGAQAAGQPAEHSSSLARPASGHRPISPSRGSGGMRRPPSLTTSSLKSGVGGSGSGIASGSGGSGISGVSGRGGSGIGGGGVGSTSPTARILHIVLPAECEKKIMKFDMYTTREVLLKRIRAKCLQVTDEHGLYFPKERLWMQQDQRLCDLGFEVEENEIVHCKREMKKKGTNKLKKLMGGSRVGGTLSGSLRERDTARSDRDKVKRPTISMMFARSDGDSISPASGAAPLPAYQEAPPDLKLYPNAVKACAAFVLQKGIHLEGIFRISGSMSTVKALLALLQNPFLQVRDLEGSDPHDVATGLKQLLRDSDLPIIPFDNVGPFLEADPTDVPALTESVALLPSDHCRMLGLIVAMMCRICAESATNKMTPANIAIVFGPTLFREQNYDDSMLDPSAAFQLQTKLKRQSRLIETLIQECETVFQDVGPMREYYDSLDNPLPEELWPMYKQLQSGNMCARCACASPAASLPASKTTSPRNALDCSEGAPDKDRPRDRERGKDRDRERDRERDKGKEGRKMREKEDRERKREREREKKERARERRDALADAVAAAAEQAREEVLEEVRAALAREKAAVLEAAKAEYEYGRPANPDPAARRPSNLIGLRGSSNQPSDVSAMVGAAMCDLKSRLQAVWTGQVVLN